MSVLDQFPRSMQLLLHEHLTADMLVWVSLDSFSNKCKHLYWLAVDVSQQRSLLTDKENADATSELLKSLQSGRCDRTKVVVLTFGIFDATLKSEKVVAVHPRDVYPFCENPWFEKQWKSASTKVFKLHLQPVLCLFKSRKLQLSASNKRKRHMTEARKTANLEKVAAEVLSNGSLGDNVSKTEPVWSNFPENLAEKKRRIYSNVESEEQSVSGADDVLFKEILSVRGVFDKLLAGYSQYLRKRAICGMLTEAVLAKGHAEVTLSSLKLKREEGMALLCKFEDILEQEEAGFAKSKESLNIEALSETQFKLNKAVDNVGDATKKLFDVEVQHLREEHKLESLNTEISRLQDQLKDNELSARAILHSLRETHKKEGQLLDKLMEFDYSGSTSNGESSNVLPENGFSEARARTVVSTEQGMWILP